MLTTTQESTITDAVGGVIDDVERAGGMLEGVSNRVLLALPEAGPGNTGGIPLINPGITGDGNTLSCGVKVVPSSRMLIADTLLTSDNNNPQTGGTVGEQIKQASLGGSVSAMLDKIWAKVARIGTIFTSNVPSQSESVVTQGDDYDSDTGQYVAGFRFKGAPSIENTIVVYEIWYKNAGLVDTLAGEVVEFTTDPGEDQEIRGIASNDESSLWPSSDISKDMEVLGRVVYASGSIRTVGRAKLDVLRG